MPVQLIVADDSIVISKESIVMSPALTPSISPAMVAAKADADTAPGTLTETVLAVTAAGPGNATVVLD